MSDFVAACLHKDPEKRLSAKELINHKFLKDVNDKNKLDFKDLILKMD